MCCIRGTLMQRRTPSIVLFQRADGDMDNYRNVVRELEGNWSSDGLSSFLDAKCSTMRWNSYSHDAVGKPHRARSTSSLGSGSGSATIGMKSAHASYNTEELWLDEAVWDSPLKEGLPGFAQEARMLFVRRAPQSRFPETHSIMLLMPCTGDEKYESRLDALALPLLEHGVASALLVPPLYGPRRAPGQKGYYANNVADYMIQSLAVIVEGAQVLRQMALGFTVRDGEHFSSDTCCLGVAGFSWGGAMASCTAVMSRLPAACVPYVGMDSPTALCTGIIRWQINWSALMEAKHQTKKEATADIEQVFKSLSLARLLETAPEPKATVGSLVQIGATSDYYVSEEDGQNWFNVLKPAVMMDALVRWTG